MNPRKKFYALCFMLCALGAVAPARAVDFPSNQGQRPFSQYGQIQNVQSYSSNPFYNPSSPYNQRFPVPVYAQGTELTAGECRAAVSSVVAMHCAQRNNCTGLRLTDIRPAVLQSLATLPGHNYVSACSGFVDEVFNEYMAQNQNLGGTTAFPSASAYGGGTTQKAEFKVENPYPYQYNTFQKGWGERANELAGLQAQNADSIKLVATEMPKTFEDLSFTERNQILAAGYAPWQCDPKTGKGCAYKPIEIETNQQMYTRLAEELQAQQQMAEAEAEAADSKAKIEKLKDYCGWCRNHLSECYGDFVDKLAKSNNEELKKAACAAKQKSVMIWEILPDDTPANCGYKLTRTLNVPLDDAECNRTPPQSQVATTQQGDTPRANPTNSATGGGGAQVDQAKLKELIDAIRSSRK